MTAKTPTARRLVAGTTGWTAHDFDDPAIEEQWLEGRHEIISGVLAIRPPTYFAGASALMELMFSLKRFLQARGISDDFGGGVDIILDEDCVVVADGVWLTADDQRRQREAMHRAGKS